MASTSHPSARAISPAASRRPSASHGRRTARETSRARVRASVRTDSTSEKRRSRGSVRTRERRCSRSRQESPSCRRAIVAEIPAEGGPGGDKEGSHEQDSGQPRKASRSGAARRRHRQQLFGYGDLPGARDACRHAQSIDNWKASVIGLNARLKLQEGDARGALAEFERAAERYPGSVTSANLAWVLLAMNEPERALEAAGKGIQIESAPRLRGVRRDIARIQTVLREMEVAQKEKK